MLNAKQRLEWDMLHRELECARAHLSPKRDPDTAPDWVNREAKEDHVSARVFVNAVRYIRMRLRDNPRLGEEWPWDSWESWAYNREIEDPKEEEEEAFLQVFESVLEESLMYRKSEERTEDLTSHELWIARQIWKAARAYKRTRFPTGSSPDHPFEMMLQITVSTALRLHIHSNRDYADTMTALAFTVVTRIKEEDEETILLRAIRKPPWRNPQVNVYTNLDVIVSDLEAAVSDRVDDISFRMEKGNASCNRGRNIYNNGHAKVEKRLGSDPFEMLFGK